MSYKRAAWCICPSVNPEEMLEERRYLLMLLNFCFISSVQPLISVIVGLNNLHVSQTLQQIMDSYKGFLPNGSVSPFVPLLLCFLHWVQSSWILDTL